MYHHENWEGVRDAFDAWWRHEMDEPMVQVVSPKAGCHSTCVFDWWALVRPGARPEEVLENFQRFCESTWFGGCAFPSMFFNMGPGVLAAFCSGFLQFESVSSTSWFENPQPWETVETYRFEKNRWFAFLDETMRLFAEAAPGNFVMGITDLGGILDVLASFRGSENLAMDLLVEPERVHHARNRIVEDWHRAFDLLHPHIAGAQEGMSSWMGLWCPGTYYPLQCDFSAMISPDQFREFVLPDVAEQCRRLDHSIYHLDGPGQIPHLDLLLEVEELDGIQWVPGDGNPQCEALQWRPLYEKILARDKLLVLNCFTDIRRVSEVLEGLPRKGILMSAWAGSEEEGRKLLADLKAC